ncbi:MAG: hypothetical protein QXE12_04055 [Conexivisphaerales archaeon]
MATYNIVLLRRYIRHNSMYDYLGNVVEERIRKQDERLAELIVKWELLESKINYIDLSHKLSSTKDSIPQFNTNRIKDLEKNTPDSTKKVLTALINSDMTANQVMRLLGCTREHAARLMKVLNERGLVERINDRKPFIYRITTKGRSFLQE